MEFKYNYKKVFGLDRTISIQIPNIHPLNRTEIELIKTHFTGFFDMWGIWRQMRYQGERVAEYEKKSNWLLSQLLTFPYVYYEPIRSPYGYYWSVDDDFFKLNSDNVNEWIIRTFDLKPSKDKKRCKLILSKAQYYSTFVLKTVLATFKVDDVRCISDGKKADYSLLSKVFNPLVKTSQIETVKFAANYPDLQKEQAVFVSDLTDMEKLIFHYVISRGQTHFKLNLNAETTIQHTETLSLYHVAKSLQMEQSSATRKKIVDAFTLLATRFIKFIDNANGMITIYPVFDKTQIMAKQGVKYYEFNEKILTDKTLLKQLTEYYNVAKLTNLEQPEQAKGLTATDVLKYKGNKNIITTCLELINEMPLIDKRGDCYTFSNVRKRMTYEPPKDWRRAMTTAFKYLHYAININPKCKDEFTIEKISK